MDLMGQATTLIFAALSEHSLTFTCQAYHSRLCGIFSKHPPFTTAAILQSPVTVPKSFSRNMSLGRIP